MEAPFCACDQETRPALLLAAAALALAPAPRAVPVDATQKAIYRARDKVFPALVHIEPILQVYRAGEKARMAVTGSGVIFSPEGYVVTNNHVVERAEKVTCFLEDQQEVPATVVGRDPETDVAVLKLDLTRVRGKLPYAELGDSSKVQVGEHVMAMGSPLGLARSVSFGVVSSVDRYLPEDQMPAGAATGLYNTWIQTDAAINPGNSGGPSSICRDASSGSTRGPCRSSARTSASRSPSTSSRRPPRRS